MRQFQGTRKPSVLQGSGQCIKRAYTVLVPSGCCNSDWVIYQHLFLTVLEAGNLRSVVSGEGGPSPGAQNFQVVSSQGGRSQGALLNLFYYSINLINEGYPLLTFPKSPPCNTITLGIRRDADVQTTTPKEVERNRVKETGWSRITQGNLSILGVGFFESVFVFG